MTKFYAVVIHVPVLKDAKDPRQNPRYDVLNLPNPLRLCPLCWPQGGVLVRHREVFEVDRSPYVRVFEREARVKFSL